MIAKQSGLSFEIRITITSKQQLHVEELQGAKEIKKSMRTQFRSSPVSATKRHC